MRAWAVVAVLIGCAGGARPAAVSERETPGVEGESESAGEGTGEGEGEGESEVAGEGELEVVVAEPVDAGPAPITTVVGDASSSTSIGGPNEGRLEGGVALPDAIEGLRSNPRRPNATAYYGTFELVRSVVDAAVLVHRELGGELTINDIGLPEGGTIPHHGSHRAGRDVDVLFYLLDDDHQPRQSLAVPIELDGHGTDFGDLVDPDDDVDVHIDLPRTWRFVQAILEDEDALVQRIFVVEHVRTMLLEEAARAHAPRAVVQRFEDVTCQPGYPHDDHLHVRFFCTTEDLGLGCEDATPIYPWRREQLEAADVEPVISHPHRHSRETAPTDAPDVPMDDAVRAFFEHREAWAHQPHPGRRYCR